MTSDEKATMKDMQIFNNPEFGEIRVVEVDGKPYAVGVDVARALEYANPSKAVIDHCKGISKLGIPHQQTNQHGYIGETIQETNVIPQGDIFRLIVKAAEQSRNLEIREKAERFERWIFDEVLPSIRQHGMYASPTKIPQTFSDALRAYADEVEAHDKAKALIEAQRHKVEFFDDVADSKDAIDISEAAKVLNIGMGRNRLFKTLRERKILKPNNIPYQEYVDRGYFRVIEQKFKKQNGDTCINIKTLVYQRGLEYIRRLLTANTLKVVQI